MISAAWITCVMSFVLYLTCVTALRVLNSASNEAHSIAKRQILSYPYTTTNLAPTLTQPSYTFSTACTSGNIIGTITSTSLYGFPATYSVDSGSGTGSYYVYAQPTTGQIYLCTPTSGTFTFNFRAANQYGAIAVPVTVTCTGTTTTTTTLSLYSTCPNSGGIYGSTYNPYSTGLTNPYSTYNPYTSGLTSPYTSYNPYATGTSYPYTGITNPYSTGLTGYPYTGTTGLTYPYTTGTTYNPFSTGITNPFSTGLTYPYTGTTGLTGTLGGTVTFSQASYAFTTSQCTAGSTVGTVSGTGSGYTLVTGGNGVFTISPTGQITLLSQLYTGTYYLVVSGGTSTNQRPVTITANCLSSGFSPALFGR